VVTIAEEISVSRLVRILEKNLSCSQTALWSNLRQLKRVGILNYGDAKTKGTPVVLTKVGKMISKYLEEKNEC